MGGCARVADAVGIVCDVGVAAVAVAARAAALHRLALVAGRARLRARGRSMAADVVFRGAARQRSRTSDARDMETNRRVPAGHGVLGEAAGLDSDAAGRRAGTRT